MTASLFVSRGSLESAFAQTNNVSSRPRERCKFKRGNKRAMFPLLIFLSEHKGRLKRKRVFTVTPLFSGESCLCVVGLRRGICHQAPLPCTSFFKVSWETFTVSSLVFFNVAFWTELRDRFRLSFYFIF